MNRLRLAAGALFAVVALAFLAVTPMNPLWCVAGLVVAAILAVPYDQVKLAGALLAILPLAAFAGRTVNFGTEVAPFDVSSLSDGERVGKSSDLLGLVAVSVTVRGGKVVAASAEAPSWVGFHAPTLDHVAAVLVATQGFQGPPGSLGDPPTDAVTRAAFAALLAK